MKISIKGGGKGKGWSNYVTRKYVTLSKEQRSEITPLSGNTQIGDRIIKSSDYKDNSITLVLSFNGKVSVDKAKAVNDEFRELFMHGFKTDEYCYEAVLHQDTQHDHIHIRIPTKNLVTDTQLRLYYHNKHKEFINSIRDYLIIKHDLPQPTQEYKQVLASGNKKEELIQEQRAKNKREPFDFTKKKGRTEGKNYINNYIADLHKAGLIDDFEDLKSSIEALDLEIVKIGKDITGDFNYFTVQDKSGGKIRLQGELYNEQFWEHSRQNRERKIEDNRIPSNANEGARTSLEVAEQRLKKELRRREKEVTARYESSRKKSREKRSTTKHNKDSDNNSNKSIRGLHRGSFGDEVSNKNTTKNDTKQSRSDIQAHQREDINDRVRATIRARIREREAILSSVRKGVRAESEGIHSDFEKFRKPLYPKALKNVRTKRERGRTRERIGNKIEEFREKIDNFGLKIYGRIREVMEKTREFVIKEINNPFKKLDSMKKKSDLIMGSLNKKTEKQPKPKTEEEAPRGGYMRM